MRAFLRHEGIAAALRITNLDTDVIIPMAVLVSVPRSELGRYAFQQIRYRPDGSEDPAFVLNQGPFRSSSILVSGRNFGCGSSREWAVYALDRFGIRVVLAPSFGDIFLSNCIKNGLLAATLPETAIAELMDEVDRVAGKQPFSIDLAEQTVRSPSGRPKDFAIDPPLRTRLLQGKDEIELTLQHDAEIKAFQRHQQSQFPWVVGTSVGSGLGT